jgi:hypothetical protein
MTIEIDNEYKSYRITDTLHQLVDRLNINGQVIDDNTRLIDSALNGLLDIIHVDSGLIDVKPNDLIINANNATFNLDSDLFVYANNSVQRLQTDLSLEAGRTISLQSDLDLLNIALKSSGTIYGGLRNNGGSIEIMSGPQKAITFTGQNQTVYGKITMPSDGSDAPDTSDKSVAGAINEVLNTVENNFSTVSGRLDLIDQNQTSQDNTLASHTTKIGDHENRIASLELLSISSRLTNIEAQIVAINNRLDLLGI